MQITEAILNSLYYYFSKTPLFFILKNVLKFIPIKRTVFKNCIKYLKIKFQMNSEERIIASNFGRKWKNIRNEKKNKIHIKDIFMDLFFSPFLYGAEILTCINLSVQKLYIEYFSNLTFRYIKITKNHCDLFWRYLTCVYLISVEPF